MANEITCTRANVRPLKPATIIRGVAAGALYKGDLVYLNSSGSWAQADGGSATTADAKGLCVGVAGTGTAAAAGGAIDICTEGVVTGYSSMTIPELFYVSNTAGSLSSAAGSKSRVMGYSLTASEVYVDIGHPADAT